MSDTYRDMEENKSGFYFIFCLVFFLLSGVSNRAYGSEFNDSQIDAAQESIRAMQSFEQAFNLYKQGDCKRAVPIYESLMSTPSLTPQLRDLVLLRKSECQLFDANPNGAQVGFEQLLKKYPTSMRVQAQLLTSYFQLGLFDELIEESSKLSIGKFGAETKVLVARAFIEREQYGKAIELLNKSEFDSNWLPVVLYWKAIAYYKKGDFENCIKNFVLTKKVSNSALWTYTAAQEWLDAIAHERQDFHFSALLGYFYDSNIGVNGGYTYLPANTENNNIVTKTIDNGYTAATTLTFIPFYNRITKVSFYISTSLTINNNFPAYNFENASGTLEYAHTFSERLNITYDLGFLDTRYAYRYFQNYLNSLLSVSWKFAPTLALTFQLPTTLTLKTPLTTLISPGLRGFWRAGFFDLWVGGNYQSSAAQGATIELVPDIYNGTQSYSVTSGTLFGNYYAYAGSTGVQIYLPWRFEIIAQSSITKFTYSSENLPTNLMADFNLTASRRYDTNYYGSLGLAKYFLKNTLSFTLTYALTRNSSSGLQGIPFSNGYVVNNNYNKSNMSLVMGYYF